MQNQRRKKESDLLKKTRKLPQKQPAKEKSPSTQQTDFDLRAVKTIDYAEGMLGRPNTQQTDSSMRARKMNGYTKGHVRRNKISPSIQQTDCGLMVVKIDDNVESRAGRKEDSWYATDDNVEGCN